MKGLMQDWPLTTNRLLEHAGQQHGAREIVTRLESGAIVRTSYARVLSESRTLSAALRTLGVQQGDRIATLAMNSAAHLTAWYAITGMGAICHTLNPRMSAEQLGYIVAHAGDRLLLADGSFAELLARLLPACPGIEHLVWLSPPGEAVPTSIPTRSLEALMGLGGMPCTWGDFPEDTAAGLCYTSGTTGDPKGVLYSHRSNVLHALMILPPDVFGLSESECILPVVPMYHANAWGIVYAGPAVGAKLVFPGHRLDADSLLELMEQEGVTLALAVPTVWLTVLQRMRSAQQRPVHLRRVIVGGAACPERLIREFAELGIETLHAWGMTETSPVGTVASLTSPLAALSFEAQLPWRIKQGRAILGVEARIVSDQGQVLPQDGETRGHLRVRGPAIVDRYFGDTRTRLDESGYFDTGDIATIDPQAYMHIADRSKDIIKSGGEWISSLHLESAVSMHPDVAMASVIGIPHERWGERPLLLVIPKPGARPDQALLLQYLASRFLKWQLPDAVLIVSELPLGPTGKVDKKRLRELHAAGALHRQNIT
jgi:acyl-CoA synthetase (AMP-forming)/AMP-acid ligase II